MENKYYISLIRIEDVTTTGVYFIIPEWNPDILIFRPLEMFPAGVKPKQRYIAQINIGVYRSDEIKFKDVTMLGGLLNL
jgi:hypothetical protein